VLMLSFAALAQAGSVKEKYRARHDAVVKKFGARPAGRDLLKAGYRFEWVSKNRKRHHWGSRPATRHELAVSARQLKALLNPPGAYIALSPSPPAQSPAGVHTASMSPTGIAACIVSRESGGNPQASNGTHFGIAQWSLETWRAHDGGE
jgi:hypothetical protein